MECLTFLSSVTDSILKVVVLSLTWDLYLSFFCPWKISYVLLGQELTAAFLFLLPVFK